MTVFVAVFCHVCISMREFGITCRDDGKKENDNLNSSVPRTRTCMRVSRLRDDGGGVGDMHKTDMTNVDSVARICDLLFSIGWQQQSCAAVANPKMQRNRLTKYVRSRKRHSIELSAISWRTSIT